MRARDAGRPRAAATLAGLALGVVLAAGAAPRAAAAPVALPPATRATLKNGLTVVILPSSRLPLVDFRLVAGAGSVHDPAGKEGLAALTASLLTQGAGGRDARAIADTIAFVGGTLEAEASAEQLVVTAEVLRKDFALGLELLRDVVARPAFPAAEVERRRDEAVGAIAAERDDLWDLADRSLLPFLYGASPLGHPALGWEASVAALTREDVVAFHDRRVRPDNAVLVVVGDVEPKAALEAVGRAFADWKRGRGPAPAPYPPARREGARAVRVVSRPEITQSQIRLACPAVPRGHPDEFPIRVANAILGGGFTSRLVNTIRVERGLTYRIRSAFTMHRGAGAFTISTFTRNATLRACVDGILEVVGTLVRDGPTEAELDKARRFLTGQFPLGLQAPDALAEQLADAEFYGLGPGWIAGFDAGVNAVTLDDVRRALKSYVCVDDLRLLVVAPPDSARAALAGLGPLEVVEAP